MRKDRNIIECIEKAFAILKELSLNGILTFKQLEEKTLLPKSTLHRYLKTLKYLKVVEETEKGKYTLGEQILTLKAMWINEHPIIRIVKEEMQKISEKTGETSHLAILSEDKRNIIYLHTVLGNRALSMQTPIGKSAPSYCTALGKALLSQLPEKTVIEAFSGMKLEAYTPNTITDLESLLKELRKIRQEGIAIDNEEYEKDVICCAVPVKNLEGKTVAAISISGFKSWMVDQIEEVKRILIETSNSLQSRLISY